MVSWSPRQLGKLLKTISIVVILNIVRGKFTPLNFGIQNGLKNLILLLKAINYFLEYNPEGYNKEKIIEKFLSDFPSEKENLEQILVLR